MRAVAALALEDAKDNTETTPKRPRQQAHDPTPLSLLRRNMFKGTAAHEEDARGAERRSEGGKEDKANTALKDLAHQLEARLRNKEGTTSGTARFKGDHPPAEELTEKNEMYNKAVQGNRECTMGLPLFRCILHLLSPLCL